MTSPHLGFKRMVVGLPQTMADREAMDATANLAECLQVELLAAFIADPALYGFAELPAARELRSLGQGWQRIDAAQIKHDLEQITAIARRRFVETVGSRNIKTGFDVVTSAQMLASLIRADDIVAVLEPAHPGERITRQFTSLLETAFATAAAILAVPRQILRPTGPILAVPAGADDQSTRIALEIAAALKEQLLVATPPGALLPPELAAEAGRLGVPVEQIYTGPLQQALAVQPPLARSNERLRIVAHDRLRDDAPQLFANLRGIPTLVVGVERTKSIPEPQERRVH